jgi:hypothetical protein
MSERPPEEPRTVIGLRTALILFGALAVFAIATLKGTPLWIALIIVFALAAKAYIHHLRSHIE